jgi:glycerol-3-phosphate dehydrogenase (NAD(P)+)
MASHASNGALVYTTEEKTEYEINTRHTNSKYLDNIKLCNNLIATTKLDTVLDYETIIIATPSHAFENVLKNLIALGLPQSTILLIATKGMCKSPLQLFSQKIESTINNSYGFISGPNFAKEVAQGKFSSITITSKDISLTKYVSRNLTSDNLDLTVSNDIITVQIAGIVKNIIAIKSGILQAQGQGENARAWLVSKALQEIATISNALGGSLESLTLPAVIGDLVLTSYSVTSRNTKFGYEFCKNNFSKDFLINYPVLVEGIQAAKLLKQFTTSHNIYLPITSSIAELF